MAPLIGIVNIEQGAFPTILRPSESTRGAVRTRFLLPGGRHTKAEVAVVQSTPKAKGRKTEAAVMIISPPTKEEGVRILRTLPIRPGTTVSLTQIPPSPSASFFAQSSKPRIELSIANNSADKCELQFEPGDSALVQLFVREVKKAVKDSFFFEYSHMWLKFYPESEPPASPGSPLYKLRPGLERSFGKLSDTSEASEPSSQEEDVDATKNGKPEVEAADAINVVPTITELKEMHMAEDEEKEAKKTSAESETAGKMDSGPKLTKDESRDLPAETGETKVAGSAKAGGDSKPETGPASDKDVKSTTKDQPASKKRAASSKASDKLQVPGKKVVTPESDSDSDSDIIVTSGEPEPMTIEKLTASMNLTRSVSATSAATTSSKKSVRFSEGTKGSSEESVTPSPPPDMDKPKVKQEQEQAPAEDDKESSMYPNPYAAGFDRTGFLRKRLYGERDKWTTTKPISIRIVTYNVNDRQPPSGTKELGPLVGHGEDDIIVVGLQEADLRSSSMLVSQGGDRAAAWEEAIFNGFGKNRDLYERVELVQYVGVALFIFARSEMRTEIRFCETSARGIGLLGFGGNKAGVAARMRIFDTTVCFVCSHLAAFANQLERRRYDYQALLTGLGFPAPRTTGGASQALEPYWPAKEGEPLRVDDCDVLFWFGDLNYRIDLEDAEVRALVESKDYKTVLTADQLLTDIEDGKSFSGFKEADINFRPTFKYVHGSVTFDPKRVPAYTDRILYKTKDTMVEPKSYKSEDLLWSDHLPLTGVYSLAVRVLDESKRSEQLVMAQCELDRLDEMYRPSLIVVEDDLSFGEVKYLQPVRRELTLKNNGRVPATFSFRTPSDGKPICQPWFWPTPFKGTVESGQELKVSVVAVVDAECTLPLDIEKDMNDVLVLQVDEGKGKESFISLSGQFVPTTTGVALDLLPRLPSAIRKLPLSTRRDLLGAREAGTDSTKGQPPREIWRLLEHLMDVGKHPGLWTGAVPLDEVLSVLDALDSGAEITASPHAVAHALLLVLYVLPTPLIPRELHVLCKIVMTRDEVYAVVEKMPGVNANVLIGVTSVVRLCCGDDVDDDTLEAVSMAVFGGPTSFMKPYLKALLEG